ncbi:hypothetical protein ACFYY2_29805 [Streptomyces sp. NPDC001822]|uniref:hypothetical protein n=1 Tax=Streptomyces sp. NPDC001822 TaxID=3364614 RepID=UPI00368EC9B0
MAITEDLRTQLQQERARRELTLGSIRSHLEEQPSANTVRACARSWCRDITALAETVISAATSTETNE